MKAYGLLAALLSASSSFASEPSGIVVSHFEPLQKLSLGTSAPNAEQKIQPGKPLTLTFDALGRSFELELEANDRLLSPASRQSLAENIALYRGTLRGRPGSWTRIVIANGVPRGLVWDGDEMFAIEAPGDSAVAADSPVVFRLADVYVVPGTMSCGASSGGGNAAAVYTKLAGELAAQKAGAPGATSQIDLGAIGDFEFVERISTGAEAAIVTRLNNVDGIFSEQLGVQINVATLQIHADADDPFSDTLDSGALLDELGFYRRDTPPHRSHGLTHLFTGRNLDEQTVGIAYLDALCSARFGAGLSEGRRGALSDSLIAAHEIGHNFGAPHDGDPEAACAAESEDFLMAPSVNGSDQFSQCSIEQMQPEIAGAACITVLPTVDMTISQQGTVSSVLLGDDVTVTFDVANVGTEPASNVAVQIALSEELTFETVEASVGSCSNDAGIVACQFGTLAGGANRTITVSAVAAEAGTGIFNASVFADTDDNQGNNDTSATVDIESAVDLFVNTLAAAAVTLNQSTSIRLGVENRAPIAATGVGLTITFNDGLRVNSAAWSLGSCTVTAQQVDCETDDFAASSSATADINLAGIATGQRAYTVSLSSAEEDANPEDNSATGTVTVNAAAVTSSGGGGGGATSLFFLCLLGGAMICARFRPIRTEPWARTPRY
ncbi:MAG TPA: M12 family metallo-peptidase [Woeseiaceae bacterium]|nr:M12 family metallo-peptidase [Woeseiaceae bacterium]